MKLEAKLWGKTRRLHLEKEGEAYRGRVGGKRIKAEVVERAPGLLLVRIGTRTYDVTYTTYGSCYRMDLGGPEVAVEILDPRRQGNSKTIASQAQGRHEIRGINERLARPIADALADRHDAFGDVRPELVVDEVIGPGDQRDGEQRRQESGQAADEKPTELIHDATPTPGNDPPPRSRAWGDVRQSAPMDAGSTPAPARSSLGTPPSSVNG